MLKRAAPGRFHATTGETVTLAAIAQNNKGVNAAAFRYDSPANLPQRQVQGHTGCQFVVDAGVKTFTVSVFFVPDQRGARYELFVEDGAGKLVPLQVTVSSATGPVVQFQIEGRRAPARAAARQPAPKPAPAGKKSKPAPRKPAAKKKAPAPSTKAPRSKGRRRGGR
jgi:hypothetical protein